ncbi:MAG TPA: tetratricopeptide repeat protein [Vicinamibacterales bacterium]|jgi:TolA-binding protein|nr:tetratricopeptide repeat protein [Vicinamibacterales bacterium]
MKRQERHHLKENELIHSIEATRDFVESRKREIGMGVIVVLVIVAVGVGALFYRQRSQSRGVELLAEAMVALNARVVPAGAGTQGTGEDIPASASLGATGSFATEGAKLTAALPKLQAASDAYPDSAAGITARYHLASALAALSRHDEAIKQFDEVIRRAGGGSIYGRMARLGKADTQARAGQVDAAIATWKEMASSTSGEFPVDAILMELARAYAQKGEKEEARKTFSQLIDQHPNSPYTAEARSELEILKG